MDEQEKHMADVGGIAGAQLKQFVDRIERLQEEIDALNADKAEVYKEAKGRGFDLPALKAVIQRRRKRDKNPDLFDEHLTLIEVYEQAIGTPVATRARAQEEAA